MIYYHIICTSSSFLRHPYETSMNTDKHFIGNGFCLETEFMTTVELLDGCRLFFLRLFSFFLPFPSLLSVLLSLFFREVSTEFVVTLG